MKSNVILINSPTITDQFIGAERYYPLGLLALGSVLVNENINVKIIDVNNRYYSRKIDKEILSSFLEHELRSLIEEHHPTVIGIGCIFAGAFYGLKIIAKWIKENYSNIPIVIGGTHATIFANSILEAFKFIDYIVIGEGEYTFLQLVRLLESGGYNSIEMLEGIAFRKHGKVMITSKNNFIKELDNLPKINYDLVNVIDYHMDTDNWYSPKKLSLGQPFPIITSRSCPERCNFCSMKLVQGLKTRFRSAENVVAEIELLYNKYDSRVFHFMDDNLTIHKRRIIDICNGIVKRNLNIQFDTPNGLAIRRLDDDIIQALISAGLTRVFIAIESGSEYIRNDVIGKHLSNAKIYEVVEKLSKYKHLYIHAFFIIGMPEETIQTLDESFNMIKTLPLDRIGVFYATPYPGTRLFNYCLIHNLLPYKHNEYMEINNLQHLSDQPHFEPFKVSTTELITFRKKCYDYQDSKRKASQLPVNYPLRYDNDSTIQRLMSIV